MSMGEYRYMSLPDAAATRKQYAALISLARNEVVCGHAPRVIAEAKKRRDEGSMTRSEFARWADELTSKHSVARCRPWLRTTHEAELDFVEELLNYGKQTV